MTTRAQLRNDLRIVLEDASGGTTLWTDAQLDECLRSGMRAYGDRRPLELSAALVVNISTKAYTLPAAVLDPRDVARVIDADGYEIPRENQPASPYQRQSWRAWANQIAFAMHPAEAGTWYVMHRSPRLLIEDDVTAQPIPADDEPILTRYAAAAALEIRATAEAKRGAEKNARAMRDLADRMRDLAELEAIGRSRSITPGQLE